MSKVKAYLKDFWKQVSHFSGNQFWLMLIGNLILALGLATFNRAGLGNHPFHTMLYSGEEVLRGVAGGFFTYANLQICLNIVLFAIQLLFGRRYIGLGTIVNMFLLGYAITFFDWLMGVIGITPTNLVLQIVVLLAATVFTGLGLSLYQTGDMGVAPYDSMPLIVSGRKKIPFFWCRIAADALCFITTLLLLWKIGFSAAPDRCRIGIGTVVTVFCTGPFIRFFDKTVSKKLLKTK